MFVLIEELERKKIKLCSAYLESVVNTEREIDLWDLIYQKLQCNNLQHKISEFTTVSFIVPQKFLKKIFFISLLISKTFHHCRFLRFTIPFDNEPSLIFKGTQVRTTLKTGETIQVYL